MMKFIIIDGNSILHRAYHALPKLTNKQGTPTGAIYGFTSMLIKIITDFSPTYLAVCFDRPEKTFREEIYKQYQAQRPKMDDDLAIQIPELKELLKTMEIPVLEKAGFEADDLIGSLTKNFTQKHTQIIIVSGDRDILQLIRKNILVYAPVKGISQAKLFTAQKVKEKYGITPAQIIDYKALAGDASDNYKGIKGLGPKTAQSLLEKFKNLENIYKNMNEIENQNLKEKLLSGKKDAFLAKRLATIITSIPYNFEKKDFKLKKLNLPKIKESFKTLGFKTLWKRINNIYKCKQTNPSQTKQRTSKSQPKSNHLQPNLF